MSVNKIKLNLVPETKDQITTNISTLNDKKDVSNNINEIIKSPTLNLSTDTKDVSNNIDILTTNLSTLKLNNSKEFTDNVLKLNYIGSKRTLLPILSTIFDKYIKENDIVGDLFTGTGIVSSLIQKKYNATMIINDVQNYSYLISKSRIESYSQNDLDQIKLHYNIIDKLPLISGFFTTNYSEKYFTTTNCQLIDTIRTYINTLSDDKIRDWLISSLISSSDKVANTSCVYGAYLKNIKQSASEKLRLVDLPIINNSDKKHQFYNMDIEELKIDTTMDVLYLDPPYNSRQYGSNYHILETIAKYDNPELKGKTLLPAYFKSKFCSKAQNNAFNSFVSVLNNVKFKILILSYNSESIVKIELILSHLQKLGRTTLYMINYKKFQSSKICLSDDVIEYLVICEKLSDDKQIYRINV